MKSSSVSARNTIPLFLPLALVSLAPVSCKDKTDSEAAPAASIQTPVASVSPSVEPGTPSTDTLVVVPGKSLGPVSVGMEEKDLEALGLPVEAIGGGFWGVGPYRVVMKSGRVESVSVEIPKVAKLVKIGEKTIDQTMTLEAAAETIGDCSAPQHNVGASIVDCLGGTVSVTRGGSSSMITSVGVSKAK